MPKNRTRIVEYLQKKGMPLPEGEGWVRGRFNPRTGDQQWLQKRVRTTPSNIGSLADPFERFSRMGLRQNTTRRNVPRGPTLGGPILSSPTFGNTSNINYGPIVKPPTFNLNRALARQQENQFEEEEEVRDNSFGLGNLTSLFSSITTKIQGGRRSRARKGKKTAKRTRRR
jgi:hypothetical protein